MTAPFAPEAGTVAPFHDAPQHRPRPLPLFMELLRSETEGQPERRRDALVGVKAYQTAPRTARQLPAEVALRHGRVTLLRYGGEGLRILFVPSLINPPSVLDLTEHNSLLRWLATQDVQPFLLDWGSPAPDERDLGIAGHVERYLLPIIRAFDTPPILAGYCLGGTMAAAAAARAALPGLVLIAAPWTFSGFPPETRLRLGALWDNAEPGANYLGMLPMEVLQTGFWGLDPAALIRKFERFGRLPPECEQAQGFVALEDWANDGAPLTVAAARELLVDFVRNDRPGAGLWEVEGAPVALDQIRCPVLNVISSSDRIVPAPSAPAIGEQLRLELGHVGMIIGSRAREALWHPLARWLSQLQHQC